MKLKYETIYRVVGEIDVNEQTYSNGALGVDEDKKLTLEERGRLALQQEMEKDESDIWAMFGDEIESVGPDGIYHKVFLYDENVQPVIANEEGFLEDGKILESEEHSSSDARDVRPTLD